MPKNKTIFSRAFWTKFFGIFTDEPLTNQAQHNFEKMLSLAQDMYVSLTSVLIDPGETTLDSIREGFFATDVKINKLETQIRREILVHLAVSGEQSAKVPGFLLLLNLIKDAERLGDYSKNIFEIFEHGADKVNGEYLERFKEVRDTTIRLFSEVHTSIIMMDAKLAQKAREDATAAIKTCAGITDHLIDNPNSCENAVAVALLFRYQKRILSHLRKIATAQFSPFDRFGSVGKTEDPQ